MSAMLYVQQGSGCPVPAGRLGRFLLHMRHTLPVFSKI